MDPLFWLLVIGAIYASRESYKAGQQSRTAARKKGTAKARAKKGGHLTAAQERTARATSTAGWWASEVGTGFRAHRAGLHTGWIAHRAAAHQAGHERAQAHADHTEQVAARLPERAAYEKRRAAAQAQIDAAAAADPGGRGRWRRIRAAVVSTPAGTPAGTAAAAPPATPAATPLRPPAVTVPAAPASGVPSPPAAPPASAPAVPPLPADTVTPAPRRAGQAAPEAVPPAPAPAPAPATPGAGHANNTGGTAVPVDANPYRAAIDGAQAAARAAEQDAAAARQTVARHEAAAAAAAKRCKQAGELAEVMQQLKVDPKSMDEQMRLMDELKAAAKSQEQLLDGARQAEKAHQAIAEAAQAVVAGLSRRHGGIHQAVQDAPVAAAESAFYQDRGSS